MNDWLDSLSPQEGRLLALVVLLAVWVLAIAALMWWA